ncbi:MAG: hypothetical protein MK212_11715 [Saprospiraceae bacterium]|nr:hypothetical protein [Saprospiraceae bacterium]
MKMIKFFTLLLLAFTNLPSWAQKKPLPPYERLAQKIFALEYHYYPSYDIDRLLNGATNVQIHSILGASLSYINSTINTELKNYQKEDILECLSTRYVVSFIISEKGEVKRVKMFNRAIDEYNTVDKILVKIITNLGQWEAGRCNKVTIPVLVRMPINLHFN